MLLFADQIRYFAADTPLLILRFSPLPLILLFAISLSQLTAADAISQIIAITFITPFSLMPLAPADFRFISLLRRFGCHAADTRDYAADASAMP